MPPELSSTPLSSHPLTHSSEPTRPLSYKPNKGNESMSSTRKKIIPVLVLILSILSVLRLLRISITTTSSSPSSFSSSSSLPALPPTLRHTCSSPLCNELPHSSNQNRTTSIPTNISQKEFKLLLNLITNKTPCNLLIFGFEPQYLTLSAINAGGTNIFLVDDTHKLSTIKINTKTTRIYKVDDFYKFQAKRAYKMLKNARRNPACQPGSSKLLRLSKCQLALTNLPQQVYELKWDVVIVDGPRGDTPEAPGRMGVIYSAGVIARAGNTTTDVVVHDVDRTIEKWFSYEFLCDENLVSSKGKLWVFKIRKRFNSKRFCPGK